MLGIWFSLNDNFLKKEDFWVKKTIHLAEKEEYASK